MKKLDFCIVDVFAEKKYAGNQLAVFRNTAKLSTEEMQAIARETNFSETTFIDSDTEHDGGFDVRIFTPTSELPFAGHPTLGTAFVIKEMILQREAERINLNLKVGQIPVDLIYENNKLSDLWMKQVDPTFGETLEREEVAAILNCAVEDLDPDFPIQEVSTGIPFYIVPMLSLQKVRNLRINHSKYEEFVATHYPDADSETVINTGFFVFCPQTMEKGNDIHARMFDPHYGVPEDPATGSANGCFLSYLLKHNYFAKTSLDLRVEQGYEMKRPSILKIKGRISENQYDIFVGGQVQMVASGEWEAGLE